MNKQQQTSNGMKISYVTNARLPTEKAHGLQIMKTCEALKSHEVEIEVLAPRRHNPLSEDPFLYYGIKKQFPLRILWTLDLIRFGRIGFLIQEITFALSAAFYLRSRKEIVYCRDEVVLATLILLGQKQAVWESHDGAWNRPARFVARCAKAMIVVSQGAKKWYEEKEVPSEKITVIPNAIDLESFAAPETKDAARKRLNLPIDAKIVMYIGRLDGWKGTDTLFEASKYLREDICVAIIGGDKKRITELAGRYPKVLFLGERPVRELPDNQVAADVLVVPNTGKNEISMRFTSPLKLIAHLASGVPIVASDLPSIREITGSGEAYLVNPDDPKALAEGIERVFNNPIEAKSRAERAKEKAKLYSWQSRAAAIIAIVEKL